MKNRVQIIKYDGRFEEKAKLDFPFVEDAEKWAEEEAEQKLIWGDTQIGLEGNTEATIKSLNDTGIHKEDEPIFQIHGLEDDGDMRELEESDWKGEAWKEVEDDTAYGR